MFNIQLPHGNYQHYWEFENPNLTPEPLRIVKRASPRSFRSSDIPPALSTSSTQQTLVPVRSSSISSGSTQIEASSLHTASDTASWAGRRRSFQMHKQCRSDPIDSSNTTESIRSGVSSNSTIYQTGERIPHYRRMSAVIDTGSVAQRRSCEIHTGTTTRPLGSRAVTTGALNTDRLLCPVNDKPLSLPTATVGRRAVTAVPSPSEAARNKGGPVLRREPSFKHRFISRMMGGLSHRSHIGHVTANEPGRSPLTLENRSDYHPAVPQVMDASKRSSSSSGETDNLKSALASFPTPPTSNEASPTAFGTFTNPRSRSRRYRELCKSEETAIMGAELRLIAEHEELNSDNEHTMLVAIEIEGTVHNTGDAQLLWSQHSGLDVAVIIDNSLYTSPNTLMASCETTRALASILNAVTDRLAVLCTSPINDHRTLGANFTKVWPLSSIKLHKLKAVLDAVINTKELSSWPETLENARELLLQSKVPDADSEILQDTFGHVIILTGNPGDIPPNLLTHDKIHFHIICPASVPRHDLGAVACNGWKLRSMSGNESLAVQDRKDTDPVSLLNRLRSLVAHARGGKDAGKLSYLSLDIKPGPKCRVDSVIGKSEYLTLHPGELRTILIRLKVPTPSAQGSTLSRSTTFPALGQFSLDIQNDLDRMLRVAPSPAKLLTARLKYKHSLLSASTTCSVVAECPSKERTPIPTEGKAPEKFAAEGVTKSSRIVHERLAYHVATHGSSEKALLAFREEFGGEGWRSHCPDYTHLILNELKYQARITERLGIDATPKKPALPLNLSQVPHEGNLSGTPIQDVSDGENARPESWYIEGPDDDAPDSPKVQLVTISELRKATKPVEQMHVELEQARLIWYDQRKLSTAPKSLGLRRAISLKLEEERRKSLSQMMVLRNQMGNGTMTMPRKKGLKAAAMKRITSAGESMGKGLGGI